MSVNEGYMSDVKAKLIEKIVASHVDLTASKVHADWKLNIAKLGQTQLPAVTVRMMPSHTKELVYGRQLEKTKQGVHVVYNFTAHVWALRASGGMKAETAMDVADAIETYLLKSGQDTTTGIIRIVDIVKRESQPERGARRYQRIIMNGRIFVRKPF